MVGGDIVYHGVHMMTAETDEQGRAVWIASLDKVAALNPQIVVARHRPGAPPSPPSSRTLHLASSPSARGWCPRFYRHPAQITAI